VKPFVREATLEDVEPIQAMFAEFVRTTQYAKYVGNDPEYSAGLIERLIALEDGAIFVVQAEDGLIGMFGVMVFHHPMSNQRVASEVFWWLNPDRRGYGVYLLRRAERWAIAHGAERLSMMQPFDKPRVGEIYAALGYSAVEVVWQKDLFGRLCAGQVCGGQVT
jgi:GNAT superfamily N-acetyltransferase